MVGFRMAGFILSGSGIRVFVLGNMGLGWGTVVGKYIGWKSVPLGYCPGEKPYL